MRECQSICFVLLVLAKIKKEQIDIREKGKKPENIDIYYKERKNLTQRVKGRI